MSGRWRAAIANGLYAPVDVRVGTWLRLGLGLLLAYAYWPDERQRYNGLLGRSEWRYDLFEEFFLHPGYMALMLVGIVAFIVGWRTRWVGLSLVALLLPHGFLTHGLQSRQILVFSLACVSLLPSRPLWRLWGQSADEQDKPVGPVWPLRLLQAQLTVIYAVNALYKTTPQFLSGRVLAELSRLPNFLVDLTSGFWRLGAWSVPVAWLAMATVVMEYALAVGFWWRRTLVFSVVLGVVFHLALKFVMRIHMLDLVTMFLYFGFLVPALINESNERK
ncbi:MAG: hypothetical protein ACAH89_12050 [Rariglobus sp.]